MTQGLLVAMIVLKLEAVPPDATRIVIEVDMTSAALCGHAIRNKVSSDPTLEAVAGCVNGGVLESASAVTGPVVRGLRDGW